MLLIVCADVAILLLARGVARRREMAIRAALGASRWRIVRQFLIEAGMLALGACALGVVFASWAIDLARPWLPQSLPVLQEMAINPTVLAFAVISAGLTACITSTTVNATSATTRTPTSRVRDPSDVVPRASRPINRSPPVLTARSAGATPVGSARVVVLTACLAAGYFPARRTARIDPMKALRAE